MGTRKRDWLTPQDLRADIGVDAITERRVLQNLADGSFPGQWFSERKCATPPEVWEAYRSGRAGEIDSRYFQGKDAWLGGTEARELANARRSESMRKYCAERERTAAA